MKIYTLNRKEKLKGHTTIKNLFFKPNTLTDYPFKFFYKWEISSEKSIKLGVSVAKRNFKKSPDRNKIKRIIREAYRIQIIDLKEKVLSHGHLLIMIVYIGDDYPDFKESQIKIKNILCRLQENLKLD